MTFLAITGNMCSILRDIDWLYAVRTESKSPNGDEQRVKERLRSSKPKEDEPLSYRKQ